MATKCELLLYLGSTKATVTHSNTGGKLRIGLGERCPSSFCDHVFFFFFVQAKVLVAVREDAFQNYVRTQGIKLDSPGQSHWGFSLCPLPREDTMRKWPSTNLEEGLQYESSLLARCSWGISCISLGIIRNLCLLFKPQMGVVVVVLTA